MGVYVSDITPHAKIQNDRPNVGSCGPQMAAIVKIENRNISHVYGQF